MAQLRCGDIEQRSSESKSAPEYLGQPLHVVVRAEGRGGEQDLDVAVDELLAQFAARWRRWRTDHDGADSRRSQHADDEVGAVGVEQSDVGALAGAKSDEPAGQSRRTAVGLGVAERSASQTSSG